MDCVEDDGEVAITLYVNDVFLGEGTDDDPLPAADPPRAVGQPLNPSTRALSAAPETPDFETSRPAAISGEGDEVRGTIEG